MQNEEVKEVLLNYMGKLENVAQDISDFASDQIPLVIQEYLSWHFYSNMISFVLMIIFASISSFICYKLFNLRKTVEAGVYDVGPKEMCTIGVVVFFISTLLLTGLSSIPVSQMVKVKVAPRVVLIDWLKDSVK
jgi:hypothetical protein